MFPYPSSIRTLDKAGFWSFESESRGHEMYLGIHLTHITSNPYVQTTPLPFLTLSKMIYLDWGWQYSVFALYKKSCENVVINFNIQPIVSQHQQPTHLHQRKNYNAYKLWRCFSTLSHYDQMQHPLSKKKIFTKIWKHLIYSH